MATYKSIRYNIGGEISGTDTRANAIDSDSYVDGSIDNAHIADDAIDSEHYAAGSIDTAHIADDQITLAKMAGGTDGNIISYDASGDPVAIATGSDGQVLTSAGAGAPPAFEAAAGVPTGVIAMWSGAANAIPSGWVACDGNNSTPNLVDKFIKSTSSAGSTGGSATTSAHTLETSEIPAHYHGIMSSYSGTHDVNSYSVVGGNRGGQVMKYTENTGGAGGHTHGQSEPVHFTLIFIMKT